MAIRLLDVCQGAVARHGFACVIVSDAGSRLRAVSTIDELEAQFRVAEAEARAYADGIAASFEEQLRLGQLRQAAMVASWRLAGARVAARLGIAGD